MHVLNHVLEYLSTDAALALLFCISVLGLSLTLFADQLQTWAKYRGAVTGRIAGGYNRAMKIMVLNRIGSVCYFLLIAFAIDQGLNSRHLKFWLSVALGIPAIPTLFLLIYLAHQLERDTLSNGMLTFRRWPKIVFASSLFASSLNLFGLTVPWIASAAYPDLRLTLANTSVFFNTFFTLINVFYIEHRFARLADAGGNEIHSFVGCILASRILAFISCALILIYV